MSGLSNESIDVLWTDNFNSQNERTYADIQYTVEHGAVCLSVMLLTAYSN